MKKNILVFLCLTVLLSCSLKTFAQVPTTKGEKTKTFFKKTGGVLTGLPGGLIIGGFRGAATGIKTGTLFTAEYLGDREGSLHRGVGFLTGGLGCGFIEGILGAIQGAYDGVVYGIDKPFSKESYSLTGNGVTDFKLLSEQG